MEFFGRFLRWLALASGGVLLVLMVFTVADVIMRAAFDRPFSGSIEFTEFCMALIVFLAIPYTGWVGAHISVDLFEKYLDRPSLRLLPAVISFIGGALFLLIAWRVALETIATVHQVSNMMRMPHYPFRFTVAFCCMLFALVLFVRGAQTLERKPVGETAQP
ncbi:MAG: TRAP transporter small permease [Pseudorhodoplanes sp.]|uniref:TRAP transporter small permease n=1 Tax=Pseudorhodoplanes sp. TaxID=1934341 RepID=UPI003D0ED9A9